MQRSIQEHLEKPKRKRTRKSRLYRDELSMGRAKVGDVIYLPAQPEHPVTVTQINVFVSGKDVEVAWFDGKGELHHHEISALGFVID